MDVAPPFPSCGEQCRRLSSYVGALSDSVSDKWFDPALFKHTCLLSVFSFSFSADPIRASTHTHTDRQSGQHSTRAKIRRLSQISTLKLTRLHMDGPLSVGNPAFGTMNADRITSAPTPVATKLTSSHLHLSSDRVALLEWLFDTFKRSLREGDECLFMAQGNMVTAHRAVETCLVFAAEARYAMPTPAVTASLPRASPS